MTASLSIATLLLSHLLTRESKHSKRLFEGGRTDRGGVEHTLLCAGIIG